MTRCARMARLLRGLAVGLAPAAGLLALGCGNAPPSVERIDDQRAVVNVELAIPVHASDPDGDRLRYRITGSAVAERISIEDAGDRAVLRFVPLISDVGVHPLTLTVDDGEADDATSFALTVSPSEGSTAPTFVQPVGSGRTMDVTEQSCIQVPITVIDPDSADVALGLGEPVANAAISPTGPLAGQLDFCPSKEQIAADDRYDLLLTADDGDNPATEKSYLIVLRGDDGAGCPGEAPVITHTPASFETVNDLTITATVSDDLGMKYAPLLYVSDSPPGLPADVTAMTQLEMTLFAGDTLSGSWSATIPNPVANLPAGSSAQLYYVIAAHDNDDPDGTCDHRSQSPADGSAHVVTVVNPGGGGDLPPCAACSADIQCGGGDDLCLPLADGNHCGRACTVDSNCPSGSYCSVTALTSVDGVAARQCIPDDYSCADAPPPTCSDDALEDNDGIGQAAPIAAGQTLDLISCDGDADWFRLTASQGGEVSLTLAGQSSSDLDLRLLDGSGALVAKSDGLSSSENIAVCVPAGEYFAHVLEYGAAANAYSLSYAFDAGGCGCVDDASEDDDNLSQARDVDLNLGTYLADNQMICSGDDDWYAVPLFAGEDLYVTLTFVQSGGDEDLDILLFDQNGSQLTNCSEQNPSGCDLQNGQSASSNEALHWPIDATATYHVVVHGWAGSANDYDICIGLFGSACP